MKRFIQAWCAGMLMLLCTGQVAGIVEPEETQLQPQSWMVNIFATSRLGFRSFMCKGALISGRWVLTAARCSVYDPYRAIEGTQSSGDPQYIVTIAGSNTPVKVLDFVQSDDGLLGLMYLETPVVAAPLAVSTATEAQLIGTDVQILGTERSKGVRDARFNPNSGLRMNCDIGGDTYVTGSSENGGAFCYLMSWPVTGSTLYRARARIIDPEAPGAPDSEMDRYGGFDRSGKRLYLDFRVGGSHPCHEDLGAPVLRRTEDGSIEAVGVVTAVGMAAGVPLCGPMLYNTFSSTAHYRQFMLDAIAQKTFERHCPYAPEPQFEVLEDGSVRLHWEAVRGATGYRLHYTAHEGYVPIQSADLGNVLEYRTTLPAGAEYSVAVSAYNAACASPVSAPLSAKPNPAPEQATDGTR